LPANEQTWNNRVFHLSLESLVLVGDLDEAKTASYKLSDEYIQRCQAKSMFSLDLKKGQNLMKKAGSTRLAMFSRLNYDLDNADRYTTEHLNKQGLTPDVVAKLREVKGQSKEEKDLEIAALELGLKALGKRILSIQEPDVPHSVWTVMCQPLDEIYTSTHMDAATYEALIEHSDNDQHPEEMMIPVSNAVP
jgi:hypothetical protein